MLDSLESVAAKLISRRKWMLIAFLISFLGVMPAAIGLMILFKTPIFFFLGIFVLVLGFAWSCGLFLISFWYNPDGGPLSISKISTTHSFFRWHAYIMRYCAPAFLGIWFLSPFIVMAIQFPFIKMMLEK